MSTTALTDTQKAHMRLVEEYARHAKFYTKHAETYPVGHVGREFNLHEAQKYERLADQQRDLVAKAGVHAD